MHVEVEKHRQEGRGVKIQVLIAEPQDGGVDARRRVRDSAEKAKMEYGHAVLGFGSHKGKTEARIAVEGFEAQAGIKPGSVGPAVVNRHRVFDAVGADPVTGWAAANFRAQAIGQAERD